MIPASLIDAIAEEGAALSRLAGELGATLSIDPHAILERDIALSPPGLWSPNRHCRLIEAADGWLAINLARGDDRDAVPAWLQCEMGGDLWDIVVATARRRRAAALMESAILLGLPIAAIGEISVSDACVATQTLSRRKRLGDMTVIDLSALWAGPFCGGLLAEAGMAVTKIESPARPDPTALSTPLHAQRLNGRKRLATMPLDDPRLFDRLATADLLITSTRAHALARLGLTPEALFARNPSLIWVAITGYGFEGPQAMRVAFGDDAAAAGGLVRWAAGEPRFLGDALADPLTGLRAARLALDWIARGQSGLIDVALAPTAADFARRADLR